VTGGVSYDALDVNGNMLLDGVLDVAGAAVIESHPNGFQNLVISHLLYHRTPCHEKLGIGFTAIM
jgi:hypothetical protein